MKNKIALLQGVHESGDEAPSGDSNFKETVVFSFARWDTSIFLAALNELHTYFVLPELYQKLIGNFNIELLFGLAESRAIQLGGHFNQVVTTEEKVSFTSCF